LNTPVFLDVTWRPVDLGIVTSAEAGPFKLTTLI